MNAIKGFFGSYRFLSNFWPCTVEFEGLVYPSSEAAFQAQKTVEQEERQVFTRLSAGAAKRRGREVRCRGGWDDVRLDVMYRVLRAKFADPSLARRLVDTGDAYLEETNYWRDVFWGVFQGRGENNLGLLLMVVRAELQVAHEGY